MKQPTRAKSRQLRLVFDKKPLELEESTAYRQAVIDRLSRLLRAVVVGELESGRMNNEREDRARSS